MAGIKKHITDTISLAVPVAASHVSDMLVLTADAVMVGVLGSVKLASVTLAGSSSIVGLLFAVGYTAAITPLAGHAYGRNDIEGVAKYVRSGLRVSVVVSLMIIVVLFAFSPFLYILGSPREVTESAIPFFRWIVASSLFRILFGAFRQTAEAMANTRAAMIINLGTNIVNVFLGWIFIYGNLNMPALGVEGAGVATFLARGVGVGAAWYVFTKSNFFAGLRAELIRQRREKVSVRHESRRIIKDGTGIGLQIVVEVLAFATGGIMMGWIGSTALAAHQASINPVSITFMVALGIGSAATIRISNLRGTNNLNGARRAALTALGLVVLYMMVIASGYVVFRYEIPRLFVNDDAVVAMAGTLLLFAAAFSLFDGLQVVGLGVLRGYNDIRIPTIIAGISYVVITIPVGYVFAFTLKFGPPGIWIGYLAGLMFAGSGYMIRIISQTRIQKHRINVDRLLNHES